MLSRRDLLISGAVVAGAAIAGIPASSVTVAVPDTTIVPTAEKIMRGWWGYSTNGGEWFHGPFDSREEALNEAQGDYPEESCITAFCIPERLRAPDLREHCIEWIGGRPGLDRFRLMDAFDGANEDVDWDGEVGDELSHADYAPLIADLRDACATALFRAGRPDLITKVFDRDHEGAISEDDALLDALGRSTAFERDCGDAGEHWIDAQNLRDVPRILQTREDQDHDAIEPQEERKITMGRRV